MTREITMTNQMVYDRGRVIVFDGVQIGHVTSKRPNAPRWTEMSMYLTEGGAYVLEKIGRSVVCHMPECRDYSTDQMFRFQEHYPEDDPDNGYVYDDCVPMEYDYGKLLVEAPRFWAKATKSPQEILEALERRRDGVTTLPRIGVELLEQVETAHPEFGDFWRVGSVR